MQFRAWLRTRPLPEVYPKQPSMDEMLDGPNTGIEEQFDIDSVRFLMLDGRYYREEKNEPASDPLGLFNDEFADIEEDLEPTNLLGENQRAWLASGINDWPGLSIICSGTTLGGKSDDAWTQYLDLEWLENQHLKKTIMLSGDIHDIKMPKRKALGDIWEFTASGAARPKFGDSGNFGIVTTVDQGNATSVEVELYDEDDMDKKKSFVMK